MIRICTRSWPCQRSTVSEPATCMDCPRFLSRASPSFCPAARNAIALTVAPSPARSRRPAEPLLAPGGHQPDHAAMPAGGRGDDDRPLLLDAERRHGLGLRLGERLLLDGLAFAVEAIELGRDARGLDRIVQHEKLGA